MTRTLNKHIRVKEDHWQRIEDAASQRAISPSRLMIEATLAINGPQWPRNDLEILMVRSCLFASQALARDMRAAGREKELEEIKQIIDSVVPPLPAHL